MKKFFGFEYVITEKKYGYGLKLFNVSCNVWQTRHTVMVTEDDNDRLMVFDMTSNKTFKFDYKYEDLKTEEDFNELIEMAENLFNQNVKISLL